MSIQPAHFATLMWSATLPNILQVVTCRLWHVQQQHRVTCCAAAAGAAALTTSIDAGLLLGDLRVVLTCL